MTPDVNKNVPDVDEDDIDTTAPSPRYVDNSDPGEWKMPEPVFRKTSGKLPTGFQKKFETDDTTSPPPTISSDGAVAIPSTEPRPKSPTLKIVAVALALAAMVAFLVVFLSVVYFFFLRSSGSD